MQGSPSTGVAVVSTDTRALVCGELFVALKGDNFDAHDFIDVAADAGVAAIMVSSLNLATERFEGGIIHVKDTLIALQELALHYRRSRSDLFVVGVTGSNGKTSTKDFLSAVLSKGSVVNATRGNLNNHIGLPLTILGTDGEHSVGVWEMGMNHPGEIEVLAEIAGPNAAVITNVGTAHIEHMKTRDAIAEEKGMLAEAVSEDGFVVLNANDPYTESIRARCRARRVITAGIEAGDVRASDIQPTAKGISFTLSAANDEIRVHLPVSGEHMVANAVLAAATALERGISLTEIAEALGSVLLSGGRLQRSQIGGVEFLDDTYNANPDSMRAALNTLASLEGSGKRIAVLGRMAELGELEESEHRALGMAVADAGIDVLIGVGAVARLLAEGADGRVKTIRSAADHQDAAAQLQEIAGAGDLVLVKGSRSSAMENVMKAFADLGEGN